MLHVQEVVRLPWLSLSVFTCTGPFRPGEDVCAPGRVPDFSPQRLIMEKSCFRSPGQILGKGFSNASCGRGEPGQWGVARRPTEA